MTIDQSEKWFVMKGGRQLGPLDYFEVIRMVQQNKIHSMDFIRKENEKSWHQVADISEFQLHNFKSLNEPELKFDSPIYNRRKHERYQVDEKVFLSHQNIKIWANAKELGTGGAGIDTIYGLLEVGSSMPVNLRIKEYSINAVVKVVSKRDWKNPLDNSYVFTYGLKFMKIDPKSELILSKLIDELKKSEKIAA